MPSDAARSNLHKLRHFLIPAVLYIAVGFVPNPANFVALLLADTLAFAAICNMLRFAPTSYAHRLMQRGTAFLVLISAYAAIIAVLIGYPFAWLLRDHSLDATLILSTAAVAAILSLWPIWPAFGLVFLWRGAEQVALNPGSRPSVLTRALRLGRQITRDNELFFSHGLPVALCLIVLIVPALAISGLMPFESDYRVATIALYALLAVPLASLALANRCADALLTHHRRPHATNDPPTQVHDIGMLSVDELDATSLSGPADDVQTALLRCARANQTEQALSALAQGADANAVPDSNERDQRSAIVLATLNPDLRLLRALIAKGADLNRAHAGLSPLIAATRDSHQGRPDAVMTLLTNGATPHCSDGEGNTPLHFAALAADPIVAALLCDAAAPIDPVNRDGLTPLGVACAAANWGLARFFLERAAKPEVERAQPALLAASGINDDDSGGVRLLLKRKAKVDARDTLGRTALMVAALHGHGEIASALIDAAAQVNLADQRGTTALMEAARSGADVVMRALCKRNAVIDAVDAIGRSALIIACQSRQSREETVRTLLSLGASTEIKTSDGRRAVDYAAALGRWNIVALIDPGYALPGTLSGEAKATADEDADGVHLLDALRFENWPVIDEYATHIREWKPEDRAQLFFELALHAEPAPLRWLLNHGMDVSQRTQADAQLIDDLLGQLPATLPALIELHNAGMLPAGATLVNLVVTAIDKDADAAEQLQDFALQIIERGAEIFANDAEGRTALGVSVSVGAARVVEALLQRGVDPNPRDRRGRTPLFDAIGLAPELGNQIIIYLLRAGADPEVVAANGETPLGLALARSENNGARRWLDWKNWKLPGRPLRAADLPAAAAKGDPDAVEKLLDLGLGVSSIDAQGATALLRAAGCGHALLIKHLIQRGADTAQTAPSGATPLSAAISARREAAVDALLEHGAQVDQRLPGGGTALMIAAALGFPDIARSLIAAHADVNAQDERGTRPLHAAAQFAFQANDSARAQRGVDLLLEAGADINASNAIGQTPLLLLLGGRADAGSATDQKNLLAILPAFLRAGADVNAQDRRGVSPLHACAMHGLLLPARALIAVKADCGRRDVLGRSAREIAHLLGYIDVAAELGQRDATAV